MAEQQQKFNALLAYVTGAVRLADSYLARARRSHQVTKSNMDRMSVAHSRLGDILQHIGMQVQSIDEFKLQFLDAYTSLEMPLQQLHVKAEQAHVDFSEVFSALLHVRVDPGLVGASENEETETLYDYVDDESVRALHMRVTAALDEMEMVRRRCVALLQNVEERVQELFVRVTSLTVRQYQIDPAMVRVQEQDIAAMEQHMNTIAALHEVMVRTSNRMTERMRAGQSIELSPSVLADFTERTSQLNGALSSMYDMLHEVVRASQASNSDAQHYRAVYQSSVALFSDLEVLGNQMHNCLRQWETLEDTFANLNSHAEAALAECRQLIRWYRSFEQAYVELLYEVERRHGMMQELQGMIDEFQEALDAKWIDETRKREHFAGHQAVYLPPQLCPAIMEAVSRIEILPSRLISALPRLSIALRPKEELTPDTNVEQSAHESVTNDGMGSVHQPHPDVVCTQSSTTDTANNAESDESAAHVQEESMGDSAHLSRSIQIRIENGPKPIEPIHDTSVVNTIDQPQISVESSASRVESTQNDGRESYSDDDHRPSTVPRQSVPDLTITDTSASV